MPNAFFASWVARSNDSATAYKNINVNVHVYSPDIPDHPHQNAHKSEHSSLLHEWNAQMIQLQSRRI